MSFACLRLVDLRRAGLSTGQKDAIRDLMYGPSIKIGMQFKSPWWERLGIVGGQSSSDLPIRDTVYPSYVSPQHAARIQLIYRISYGPDNTHASETNSRTTSRGTLDPTTSSSARSASSVLGSSSTCTRICCSLRARNNGSTSPATRRACSTVGSRGRSIR
ncbi:hypothetical protein C8F01DRAFT_1061050, partial [Mycena amicta]